MMKKLLAIVLSLVMLTAASAALAENKTVGILQSAEHGSLDNCREGFLQGLAEAGYVEGENLTIKYYNAQADGGTDAQIAQSLVAYPVDLICAIATPSAQAAFMSACMPAPADESDPATVRTTGVMTTRLPVRLRPPASASPQSAGRVAEHPQAAPRLPEQAARLRAVPLS